MTARREGRALGVQGPGDAGAMTGSAVSWRRVGLFYGIAFGGAWVVALALRTVAGVVPTLVLYALMGVFYMMLPLVAGLVTERVVGRRTLLRREGAQLRRSPWRTLGRVAWVSVAAYLATFLGLLVAGAGGALLGLPGAGELLTTSDAVRDYLTSLLPPGTDPAAVGELPPLGIFVALALVQALVAGFTINAVAAFGEEYGWRGVLAEELEPLGATRATVLVGVLWGLWHAPAIILLGHNYGPHWAWGVWAMVAWTIPFSFLLRWTRERTGSVLAPSVVHGAVNGIAGVFGLLLAGGSVLVKPPAGLLGALGTALAAVVVWLVWRPRRTDQSARP